MTTYNKACQRDITPNYLLGVEEKEEDAFDMEMKNLLRRITDDRVKAIFVAQIKVVANI